MATAPQAFRQRVMTKVTPEVRPSVVFDMILESDDEVDEEGNPLVIFSRQLRATKPTDERLFMLAALAGDDEASGSEEAAALWALMKDAFSTEDFQALRRRLLDPEDPFDIREMQRLFFWLMEQWSTFPTEQPSASAASPQSTGQRSTGRVRGPGSTRSTSPSTGS